MKYDQYDGYCSDTTASAAATPRRRRRTESCKSFTCISPRFLLCRWFNNGGSLRNRVTDRNLKMENPGIDFGTKKKTRVSKGLINHEALSSSPRSDFSETEKKASLNLGVGFAIIYLVAANRNELNRMEEMQKKMEFLLHNFQGEPKDQENKPPSVPSKSNISCSIQETVCADENNPGQYLSSDDAKHPEISFGSYRREKSLRMDQLQVELEAEFDRLQLHMETDFCLNYLKRHCSESHPWQINVEDSAPEESQNTSFEEAANEQQGYSYYEFNGVHPLELERRLHELLETRQQERINELESALDYVIQQLEEKESELSWWKDTARLVSQHLPAIPNLVRHMKQHNIHSKRNHRPILEETGKYFGGKHHSIIPGSKASLNFSTCCSFSWTGFVAQTSHLRTDDSTARTRHMTD